MPLENENSFIAVMRKRLAQFIETSGTSQSRIAKELGVSKNLYSQP